MKKVAITLVVLLGGSAVSMAQEQNPQTPPRTTKIVKIEKQDQGQNTSKEDEIKNLRYQLDALDNKESLIRQNPEETKIATEQGWFEQAENTRAKIRARIKELEK